MICYNYPRVYLSLFSFKSSICGTSRRISQLPEAQRWQQTPKIATWIMHELHISLSHMLFTSTNKGKERSPFSPYQSMLPRPTRSLRKICPKTCLLSFFSALISDSNLVCKYPFILRKSRDHPNLGHKSRFAKIPRDACVEIKTR